MPRWCRQEGKGRAAATGRWCEGVSVMIVTRHGAQAAPRCRGSPGGRRRRSDKLRHGPVGPAKGVRGRARRTVSRGTAGLDPEGALPTHLPGLRHFSATELGRRDGPEAPAVNAFSEAPVFSVSLRKLAISSADAVHRTGRGCTPSCEFSIDILQRQATNCWRP